MPIKTVFKRLSASAKNKWTFGNILSCLQAGMFSVATEDVMKNRSIKKAKRRNAGAEVTLLLCPSRHPSCVMREIYSCVLFLCNRERVEGLSKLLRGSLWHRPQGRRHSLALVMALVSNLCPAWPMAAWHQWLHLLPVLTFPRLLKLTVVSGFFFFIHEKKFTHCMYIYIHLNND